VLGIKIRAVFNEFDKDSVGTIDSRELHAAMNKAGAGLSGQDLAAMMKEATLMATVMSTLTNSSTSEAWLRASLTGSRQCSDTSLAISFN
jgi:Ca2+-binding EF-hand superfamily protein